VIVAAGDDFEPTAELVRDGGEAGNALKREIAQVIHRVASTDGVVPQPDQLDVHRCDRRNWAVAVLNDVGVAEVVVGGEEGSHGKAPLCDWAGWSGHTLGTMGPSCASVDQDFSIQNFRRAPTQERTCADVGFILVALHR
jgi:hypothetical protein